MTTDTQEKVKIALGLIASQGDGYQLGQPWRFSDESVVAILPITRELEKERSYVTFTEAGEILKVTEIGKVNEIAVENKDGTAVFLRSGELLVGGTQARTIVDSRIVESGEKVTVPVVCVHQSSGLRGGAGFKSGGYTPRGLYSEFANLRERETSRMDAGLPFAARAAARNMQGRAWSSISRYTSDLYASPSYTSRTGGLSAGRVAPSDDLVQAVGHYSQAIGDVIAKVPWVENQVGLATIGTEGIIAFECYDLRQSWSAVREAAVKQQGEDLSKVIEDVDQVFRYEPENAGRALRALLTSAFDMKKAGGNATWTTHTLKSSRYIGEATVHQDELVHVYLVKK